MLSWLTVNVCVLFLMGSLDGLMVGVGMAMANSNGQTKKRLMRYVFDTPRKNTN